MPWRRTQGITQASVTALQCPHIGSRSNSVRRASHCSFKVVNKPSFLTQGSDVPPFVSNYREGKKKSGRFLISRPVHDKFIRKRFVAGRHRHENRNGMENNSERNRWSRCLRGSRLRPVAGTYGFC